MVETRQGANAAVENYKLSEIFAIIPEYDGNPIFLNAFISSCTTAQAMAEGNQVLLLALHIKNKLRGRASELINSRNPSTWDEIKTLLENHFGDSRDLSAFIQDLQRMRQLPNESPLTFVARLQTHEAKMHSAVNKQNLTAKEKLAQIALIDSMALNALLTGLEPRVGQIIRASDPPDIITAISRIRRELQLRHLETQKFPMIRHDSTPVRKPNPTPFVKQCSFCKRTGHLQSECITKQRQMQPPNPNFSQSYRPNPFSSQQNTPFRNNPNPEQHRYPSQNHPSTSGSPSGPNHSRPNPNSGPNYSRPNPNYFKHSPQRTHHVAENTDFHDSQYQPEVDHYYPFVPDTQEYYSEEASGYEEINPDYTEYVHQQNDFVQNFQQPSIQNKPPDHQMDNLQAQIQTMNLKESFNPNINFPEQNFL